MQQRRQSGTSRRRSTERSGARKKASRTVKSILQIADEARSLATQADWQKLPADLSKRFDEYHIIPSQA